MEPVQTPDSDLDFPTANFSTISTEVKDLVAKGTISTDLVKRFLFVPLRMEGSELVIAIERPSDLGTRDMIGKTLGLEIQAEKASDKAIRQALRQHFKIELSEWADLVIPGVPEASTA